MKCFFFFFFFFFFLWRLLFLACPSFCDSVILSFRQQLRVLLSNFTSLCPILFNFHHTLTIRQNTCVRIIDSITRAMPLCYSLYKMCVLWLVVNTLWNQFRLQLLWTFNFILIFWSESWDKQNNTIHLKSQTEIKQKATWAGTKEWRRNPTVLTSKRQSPSSIHLKSRSDRIPFGPIISRH